ncbi:zinc finger BED domain-containing protein DAYSLEEPER-like [Capsicum chacoense]
MAIDRILKDEATEEKGERARMRRYRMAAECARNALLLKVVDNKKDAEKFRSDLMNIAMTTLSSKILSQDKEHFAKLSVDAVMRLKGRTNLEAVQIIKKPGGSLKDSFLDEGLVNKLEKSFWDNFKISMEDNEESCEVSSSVPRKRAKRNTSIVWNTFTRLPRVSDSERSKAQCQVCKEIFVADSGTTNMKRHMAKHLDNGQNQVCASIDQVVYREKMSVAILKHNYPFSFVEHQENRKIHLYLNSTVKTISRNTAKADILKFFIKEWGIEKKIFTLTLDNASCNKGVVDHLKSHLSLMHSLVCDGKLFHIRCGNHILNLIVKAGLEKADEAIEKVREGVKHIKHSEGRILKFVECIKNHGLSCSKKLRQDVTTRWNSTYQMLDSALLYQQAYMATLMLRKFKKYWRSYSMILSIAIVLDPQYKMKFVKFCFSKIDPVTENAKVEKVLDHLELLFKEYLISSTSISLSMEPTTSNEIGDVLEEFDVFENQSELGRNKTQLDLYLEEPKLDRKANPNLDVLAYWKENSARYPELSLMARDVLSIPITTVASESTFSIGGRIIGKFQSSILPTNAEARLCARDWLC